MIHINLIQSSSQRSNRCSQSQWSAFSDKTLDKGILGIYKLD